MGWEVFPEGLYQFLTRTAKEYSGDLPIFVTENGMANADRLSNGAVDDQTRIDYINQHMAQVQRAMSEGVPLQGYMLWSLLDNYEWALGYEKRFGLVHVDFDTMERTPKQSYLSLKDALSR
jgi:beta-glucosidase